MYDYLKGKVLTEDSAHQRYRFFVNYHSALMLENRWFTRKLSNEEQAKLKPFLLPMTLINKDEFSFKSSNRVLVCLEKL